MEIFMTATRATVLTMTLAGMLSMLAVTQMAVPAEAARPSQKQLLAACRAKFGMGVTSVSVSKNGRVVCQQGPGPGATRKEVFDYCKKNLGATTLTVRKKANGKWECRYYGRY
jgi:hypothetical protein